MPNIVRRIVSGPKARLVDTDVGVDLDLSYITERIILMGFPASGLQGMYRNRRRDVVRFLESKHADHYRIFNLCPSAENTYDPAEFDGRVSRFPWPDHHPPPLSMIPLFVSDMTAWLAEDDKNVVVIHCKAGKGRSSTAAALYSISLPILPGASLGKRIDMQSAEQPAQMFPDPSSKANTEEVIAERLRAVMDLLTQRRLKPSKKQANSLANEMGTEAGSALEGLPERSDQDTTPNGKADGDAEAGPSLPRRKSLAMLRRPSLAFLGNRNKHIMPQERAQSEPFVGLAPGGKPQFQSVRSVRPSPGPTRSTVDLRALGASPMGRSTDALTARHRAATLDAAGAPGAGARSTLSLAVPFSDPWASALSLDDDNGWGMSPSPSMNFARVSPQRPPGGKVNGAGASAVPYGSMEMLQSPVSMANGHSRPPSNGSPSSGAQSPNYDPDTSQTLSVIRSEMGQDDADFDTTMEEAPLEDPEDPEVPRMAISIASQRRMIGYFARLLAGSDPRRPLYFCSERPVHNFIRITKITVDRRASAKSPSSKSSSLGINESRSRSADNISIQLGRYEPNLVERLENWERGARRRAKAFRHVDPSGLAPLLPEDETALHDTYEGRSKEEARQRAQAREEARWRGVEQENLRQRRLAQHGNEAGVGDWGINVWAESETARNFAWGDSEAQGSTAQIETFALLPAVKKQSSVGVAARPIVRHTFDPSNGIMSGGVEIGQDPVEHGRWVFRIPPTPSHDSAAAIGQDSTDRSTMATSMTTRTTASSRRGPPTTAPTTPDRSRSRISGTMDDTLPPDEASGQGSQGKGIVVDADRELMIKVLLGRTGKTAAKLPDVAATGYVWFIPSFEEPELDGQDEAARKGGFARRRRPRKRARTEVRFGPAEIDFRKKGKMAPGGEIRSVSVEWEWVQTAWDHEDQEDEEVMHGEADDGLGNGTFA